MTILREYFVAVLNLNSFIHARVVSSRLTLLVSKRMIQSTTQDQGSRERGMISSHFHRVEISLMTHCWLSGVAALA